MPIQTSLNDDVAAIRRLCRKQWKRYPNEILSASPEFYGTVTGFFNQALDLRASKDPLVTKNNRNHRCWVLDLFIGRRINSFKLLTLHECEILLNALKAETEDGKLRLSQHGIELIQYVDQLLEERPDLMFGDFEEPEDDNRPDPERDSQAPETKTVEKTRPIFQWPTNVPDLW